jgi:hypothetical protein
MKAQGFDRELLKVCEHLRDVQPMGRASLHKAVAAMRRVTARTPLSSEMRLLL